MEPITTTAIAAALAQGLTQVGKKLLEKGVVDPALEPATGTSILNILPARVTGIAPRRPGRVMVRFEVGGTGLLAAVTERSAAVLDLKPGREVFAQIKSIALL